MHNIPSEFIKALKQVIGTSLVSYEVNDTKMTLSMQLQKPLLAANRDAIVALVRSYLPSCKHSSSLKKAQITVSARTSRKSRPRQKDRSSAEARGFFAEEGDVGQKPDESGADFFSE